MSLMEKISEHMKVAMKSRDKLRLETLRTVRAQLLEKQVEKRPAGGMTADDELAVLVAASKKRKEAIEIYRSHNRNDIATTEEQELAIIQEYMPKQLSPQEIEELIRKTIHDVGASSGKDFGKVTPVLMRELKGKAEGKLVQEMLRKLLGLEL